MVDVEEIDSREPESFHREMYMEGVIDGITLALNHPDKMDQLRLFREQLLSSKVKAAWGPTLVGLEIIKLF